MSDTAHATSAALDALEPTLLPDGPIIVASDTSPDSDAAFPVATALAGRAGAAVQALTVVEAVTAPMYGVDGMVVSLETAEEVTSSRQSAAAAQLLRMAPRDANWPLHVVSGEPAREIAKLAHDANARLIVVGRGRHHGMDRILGGESVLRLLQITDVPVLAVEPTLTAAPRRVVIAMDFSMFSQYAAQVALTLAAPDAQVWMVHVGPPFDESVPFLKDRAVEYREWTSSSFGVSMRTLRREGMRMEAVTLTGGATNELVRFITEQQADLVVTATHGYGFFRRMILGSVAADLLRNAPCSVLIVPASARTIAAARARTVPNARTRTLRGDAIDAELAAFSTRNVGRRCTVEVDQADLGAQVLGHDLGFVGASYDRHASLVSLMFGTSTLKGLHLTHAIHGATEVNLSSNAGGEDQVLRIAHEGGQTLVTLT